MHDLDRLASTLSRAGVRVEKDLPLSELTTFRIGGPARLAAFAQSAAEIALALAAARDAGVSARCLGGGSNVLASDDGYDGLILLNRIGGLSFREGTATVGGGYDWDDLVQAAVEEGLGGVAAMSGIPGSVGGAIYGNAGAYGECVSDRLLSITLVDAAGKVRTVEPAELGFTYRGSALKRTGEVAVEATFRLDRGDSTELLARREGILATRRSKHPAPEAGTAGSFFKNIERPEEREKVIQALGLNDDGRRIAAGLVLDKVGARGMREGDAAVFEKHANIIVNVGHASAGDVLALSGRMRGKVLEMFGIGLEREVMWLGPESTPGEARETE